MRPGYAQAQMVAATDRFSGARWTWLLADVAAPPLQAVQRAPGLPVVRDDALPVAAAALPWSQVPAAQRPARGESLRAAEVPAAR